MPYPIAAVRGGKVSASSEPPLVFLLRDEFVTAAEAPLSSPRTCEPGPGALTLVQNDGQMSVANGALVVPLQATPGWNDLGYYGPAITRAPGVLAAWLLKNADGVWVSKGHIFQMRSAAGVGINYTGDGYACPISNFGPTDNDGANNWNNYAPNNGNDWVISVILRSAGAHYVIDGKVIWVGQYNTAGTLYPNLAAHSSAHTQDYLRVAQLGAPWATDRGIATHYDATPAADDTATSESDALQYIEWTPGANEVMEIMYRRVDDDNTMILRCNQAAGTMTIIEKVGGTETTKINKTGLTWTVGTKYRVGLCYQGRSHWAWVNRTLQLTYVNASTWAWFNLWGTGCKVTGFATAEDWEIYPVWLSGAALSEWQRYTNPYYGGYRTQQVIDVADGGDIAAACASMRRGDIINLAANGTYTLAAGMQTTFANFKSGFSDAYRSEIRGNGATIVGGNMGMLLQNLRYFKISNLNFLNQTLYCYQINFCRDFELDNVDASAPNNGKLDMYDITHFDWCQDGVIKNCVAGPGPSQLWSCDGFEVYGSSRNIRFEDCISIGVVHGYETWAGGADTYSGMNKDVLWLRCHAENCIVGFSSEGGTQSLAHENMLAEDCTVSGNTTDYQGVEGATLYRRNSPGTTSGSVVDL